jgi:hypothetical protein
MFWSDDLVDINELGEDVFKGKKGMGNSKSYWASLRIALVTDVFCGITIYFPSSSFKTGKLSKSKGSFISKL